MKERPKKEPPEERPIIFSGPMIRAILSGNKVQTRRVIKPQPMQEVTHPGWYSWKGQNGWQPQDFTAHCQFKLGQRLWVRETTRIHRGTNVPPTATYVADLTAVIGTPSPQYPWTLRRLTWWYSRDVCPSIHMPKAVARIWLEVVSVRMERLQEISEEDAIAEGVQESSLFGFAYSPKYQSLTDERYDDLDPGALLRGPVGQFAMVWDSRNAKRGHPWSANDWVWVVELGRLDDEPHTT